MADKQTKRGSKPKDTKSITVVSALDEIIVYAERYAIGRHTYASPTLATLIVEHMECWSPLTKHVLIKDIKTAFADHGVDPFSTEIWRDTLRQLERVSDLLTTDRNANRDSADAPSQEGIGKKQ